MKNSIIIPVYNEADVIGNCLKSLSRQTNFKDGEIILVDDGSTDATLKVAAISGVGHKTLSQNHQGPGAARNLAAKVAKGNVLVFVDADMEFDPDFIEKLTAPILNNETIGTYSTEELLLNKDNPWAVCWNLNFTGSFTSVTKQSDSSVFSSSYRLLKQLLEFIESKISPIAHKNVTALGKGQSSLPYRAILKEKFLSVGGFSTNVGYTDDWTLAEKLNQLPTPVSARYYHKAPASLPEIFRQARWVGRGQLNTGNLVRQIHALIVHNPIISTATGLLKALEFKNLHFFFFRLVYDFGITTSVLESFFNKTYAR